MTHTIPTFPPPCPLCEVFATVVGLELGKAVRLIRRVAQQECQCGIVLGAHGLEHPHAVPLVGCTGIRP